MLRTFCLPLLLLLLILLLKVKSIFSFILASYYSLIYSLMRLFLEKHCTISFIASIFYITQVTLIVQTHKQLRVQYPCNRLSLLLLWLSAHRFRNLLFLVNLLWQLFLLLIIRMLFSWYFWFSPWRIAFWLRYRWLLFWYFTDTVVIIRSTLLILILYWLVQQS